MRLSFITSTYNGLEYTKEMLRSLAETVPEAKYDYEHIIVDDGSSDGTRVFLLGLQESCKILLNSENSGFAYSNNRAARIANGDYLVFLNNDLVLSQGWLEPMLDVFRTFHNVGAVGNVQFNPRTGLIDHAGIFFDLMGCPMHARKNRKTLRKEDYFLMNAVTAACMIVPKTLFLELGGFDEVYINGSEDVDFCMRLRKNDKKIYLANRSIIQHYVSVSLGRNNYNDQNTRIFMERWSRVSAEFGKREWPREYLVRYSRQWWRFNGKKFLKALYLLAKSH